MARSHPGTDVSAAGAPGLEEAPGAGPELNGPFLSPNKHTPCWRFVCALASQAVPLLLSVPGGSAWGRRLQERWAPSTGEHRPSLPRLGPPGGSPLRTGRTTWGDKTCSPAGTDLRDLLAKARAPCWGLARIPPPAPPAGHHWPPGQSTSPPASSFLAQLWLPRRSGGTELSALAAAVAGLEPGPR